MCVAWQHNVILKFYVLSIFVQRLWKLLVEDSDLMGHLQVDCHDSVYFINA